MTLLLRLAGCLFLAEPPPGADPSPECADTGCADGFTCDTFLDECAIGCDDLQPCQSGYSCELGDCVEDCDDSDCDDNLACNSLENECYGRCYTNDECADGFVCCTTTKRDNGKCDDVGACY